MEIVVKILFFSFPNVFKFNTQIGQRASYSTLDRIFDTMYPLYDRDLEEFLKEEEIRMNTFMTEGVKKDKLTRMIEF